jgi:hypothetical protein
MRCLVSGVMGASQSPERGVSRKSSNPLFVFA